MDPLRSAYDDDEIGRTINVLFAPESIVELRAMGVPKSSTVSGYFDGEHRERLIQAAVECSGKAPGVYVTLNPVNATLLARANNRAKPFAKNTTKDSEIDRRIWLPIDFDPKRPAGISATEAEHEAAVHCAGQCREFLREQGWSDPILADSGNGAHLLYRIDLHNDPASTDLLKRILESLAGRFSDSTVDVDRTVFNAARIWKLYGTLSAKGDHTAERPHRIARILELPDRSEVVPTQALESLAASHERTMVAKSSASDEVLCALIGSANRGNFDLDRWITDHHLPVVEEKPWGNGGRIWILNPCPWNPQHDNWATSVGRLPNGGIFARCLHNGCTGKGWHDLRDVFEPGWREHANSEGPTEAVDDPDRLSRLIIESDYQHADGPTLRSYQDGWYRWNGPAYFVVPDGELDAELNRRIKPEFDRFSVKTRRDARKVTPSLLGNVRLALRSKLIVPGSRAMPCWVDRDGPWPAYEVLAAANGLFHLPSLADGEWNQIPPTPLFFSTFSLDYQIVPNPDPPVFWLEFLGELWPDDPACVATLQEFMGNFLTHDTRHQKILMLIGPKRSGKGTIAKVITGLVGQRNVAGPTLGSLKSNFGLQPLVGKPVAIFSDARMKKHDDAIVERLLTISGEDLVTIDRKYVDPISVRLPTRLVYISNELPRFKDPSGALANRMIILRLRNSFFGKEDPALGQRLLSELPGILLWAVEGWRRLRDRGHYVQPESGMELRDKLESVSSEVRQFIKERCNVGLFRQVPKLKLYKAYREWCQERGIEYPLADNTFGGDLRACEPTIEERHPTIDGKRVWCYTGIDLDV